MNHMAARIDRCAMMLFGTVAVSGFQAWTAPNAISSTLNTTKRAMIRPSLHG